jgi:hypothetical protein
MNDKCWCGCPTEETPETPPEEKATCGKCGWWEGLCTIGVDLDKDRESSSDNAACPPVQKLFELQRDNAELARANTKYAEREGVMRDAFNSERAIVTSQLAEFEEERDQARAAARIAAATVVQVINERTEAQENLRAAGDCANNYKGVEEKLQTLKEEVSGVADDMAVLGPAFFDEVRLKRFGHCIGGLEYVFPEVDWKSVSVDALHDAIGQALHARAGEEAVGVMPAKVEEPYVNPLPERDCTCTACVYLRKKQQEQQ